MCLSTVVKQVEGKDPEEICSNVSEVEVDGDRITFTDIIGSVHEVMGRITCVDLIKNKIFVETAS